MGDDAGEGEDTGATAERFDTGEERNCPGEEDDGAINGDRATNGGGRTGLTWHPPMELEVLRQSWSVKNRDKVMQPQKNGGRPTGEEERGSKPIGPSIPNGIRGIYTQILMPCPSVRQKRH